MLKTWILAARLRTLPAAIAPVAIGTALAYHDGQIHWPTATICLAMALVIQVATNFANDYFDFIKGADDENRLGPTRMTQSGAVSPETMRRAMLLAFGVALLFGAMLLFRGGWIMGAICIASVMSGYLYTGGPYPLGYHGLGELFVLIFFGPVAVGGTYYVQALTLHSHVLIAGLAPGLISTAIIVVNNLRDVEGDRRAGKRTLVVRFGESFAKAEYLVCLGVACLIPLWLTLQNGSWIGALSLLVIPAAIPVIRTVLTQKGRVLNEALASTGKLLLILTLTMVVEWVS